MTLTTYTLTGNWLDILGAPVDPTKIRSWVELADTATPDPATGIRLGPSGSKITVDTAGGWSVPGIPAATWFRVIAEYVIDKRSGTQRWASRWVQLTSNSRLDNPALDAIGDEGLTAEQAATITALDARVDALEASGGGGGGGATVYVQDDEPVGPTGTLWADTDEAFDLGDILGLVARVETLEDTVGTIDSLPAGALITATWTTGTAGTAARPTARTDIRVLWTGPVGSTPANAISTDIIIQIGT